MVPAATPLLKGRKMQERKREQKKTQKQIEKKRNTKNQTKVHKKKQVEEHVQKEDKPNKEIYNRKKYENNMNTLMNKIIA